MRQNKVGATHYVTIVVPLRSQLFTLRYVCIRCVIINALCYYLKRSFEFCLYIRKRLIFASTHARVTCRTY